MAQARSTTEQGTDIIARRASTGETVLVEAKGGTSSKQGTARFGKPFSASQVLTHIAEAFLAAAKLLPKTPDPSVHVVIALPDTPLHRRQVERALHAFAKLGISVWWVGPGGNVEEAA